MTSLEMYSTVCMYVLAQVRRMVRQCCMEIMADSRHGLSLPAKTAKRVVQSVASSC